MTDDRFVVTPEMKAHEEAEEKEKAECIAEQEAADLKAALEIGPRKGPSPTPEPKTAWPVLSISVKDKPRRPQALAASEG